ncbi:MAG TPA: S8/S53 family peptidase [Bacteroidales bacterium]|nr:S8/S53 family peptidase [Bacteroidales bacterium]
MKKICFITVYLIWILSATAQSYFSADSRLFLADMKFCGNINRSATATIMEKYPVYKFGDKYYVSCLAKTMGNFGRKTLESQGIITGSQIGNVVTLRIPLEDFNEKLYIPGISYIEIAGKAAPNLNRAIKDTRTDSVWKGIMLPQPFTGKDVLIGITDWGFDYTNPMFYDTTLSHTRILKAWDQYRNAGPPPAGFTYGTEIEGETNLLLTQCDTFNIYEWATHGSHVAGICGGSGAGTPYRGIAFEANYLMATILVDMAAVLDAYNWMYDYAQSEGKRLVINQSWGLYWTGTLDGTSLLSQAINQYSSNGVVFVSSAGNNGDVNMHVKHTFSSPSDTMKTQIVFDNYSYYPKMWGQSVTIWGEAGNRFDISIKVLNSLNEIIAATPVYSSDDTASYTTGQIIIGSDTVFYNLASDSANPLNNRPHMRLRVQNLRTSLYKIALFANAPAGTIHCWNIIELTNDVGNWGSPFNALLTGWKNGDYYSGISEPACTQSVITVAAHMSELELPNGNIVGGSIAAFSSYGPTYDGRLKPDISAPGVNAISSVSSFTNQALSSPAATVSFGGRSYQFVPFSGTSMSSPMVTGIVALMLQANPALTPQQVKDIIITTAREDIRTGIIPDTGSLRWGWGKIHAWNAVRMAYAGIAENKTIDNYIIYPNPAADILHIIGDTGEQSLQINIYNTFGSLVFSKPTQNQTLDVGKLSPGVYLMDITNGKKRTQRKLVKL